MFTDRYRICEAFGIPIFVNSSFVFLLLLFVVNSGSISFGVAMALILALSVVLHELGHALTARAFGYMTNSITLSLLGGCASFIALPRKAWQEFLTAVAGPLVSFALAGAVLMLDVFGVQIHSFWLREVLRHAFWMNLMLGLFNLLPGFPMDGGRIFRSTMRLFLSRPKATLVAMWVGRVFAVLLAFRGLHLIVSGGGWGFITLLIAWMIWKEGYREYLMAIDEERFFRWTQDDFDARVSPPPYDR